MSAVDKQILAYGIALALIAFGGGLVPLYRKWTEHTLCIPLSFAAGVLLGASFLHMVPESGRILGSGVGFPVLAGFVLIYLVEKVALVHACDEHGCEVHTFGLVAFLGIGAHSLLDGLALGSSAVAGGSSELAVLGPAVFAAILVHKLPVAFSVSVMLLASNYSRKKLLWLLAGFALATPFGLLVSYTLLKTVSDQVLAWAVGVSAGTFLAVATADILPSVHREHRHAGAMTAAFLGGIAITGLGHWL